MHSADKALAHAKLIYSQQGPRAALPEYESVLESYKGAGNRHGEAITQGLIENCYHDEKEPSKALSSLPDELRAKRMRMHLGRDVESYAGRFAGT
jgi:hypothetical protein